MNSFFYFSFILAFLAQSVFADTACDLKIKDSARRNWAQELKIDPSAIEVYSFKSWATRMSADNDIWAEMRLTTDDKVVFYKALAKQMGATEDCSSIAILPQDLAKVLSTMQDQLDQIEKRSFLPWSCQAYCGTVVAGKIDSNAVTGDGITAALAFKRLACNKQLFIGSTTNANGSINLVSATLANACVKN